MPQTNSFISTNITIDDVSRALKDIASNQQLDDDIQTLSLIHISEPTRRS